MGDVQVTLYGYVGQEVTFTETGKGDVASFRVGTTPRIRDFRNGGYRNGETVWTQVAAWRTLAKNVAASLTVGDPVVVVGRMRTRRWTDRNGEARERNHVEAQTVAHDLAWGTSAFRRNPKQAARDDTDDPFDEVLTRAEQAPVTVDPATGEIRSPDETPDWQPGEDGEDSSHQAA